MTKSDLLNNDQAEPEVTVLISVHNSAATLNRALTSIINQTVFCHIVCINDASTDDTATILADWCAKHGSRFHLIVNKKNLGLTKSLNKGLRTIKTPFTARLDADDWWEPTKLEKQLDFLHAHPDYGVVGCWYINSNKMNKHQRIELPENDAEIRRSIVYRNPFAHSCVVFNTELIRKLSGYNDAIRYGQDYDLWFRCLPATKLANIPEVLCFRQVGSGISVEKQRQQMRQAALTRLKYIREYEMNPMSYLALIEPLAIMFTPSWIKKIKRTIRP